MKKQKMLLAMAIFGASLFMFATASTGHAFAATKTWTGAGGDTNMNTAGNWGGVAPSAGDDLIFPESVANKTVVNNYGGGTSFNSITFNGVAASPDYTISGNSMTVVAGISITSTGMPVYTTISAPLVLNGAQSITVAGTTYSGLVLSGTVNFGASTVTANQATNDYLVISGVVSGSGSLTKTGAGSLTISGANSSYTGAITASAGTLDVADPNGLGATSAGTTISSGADLFISTCAATLSVAENITLTGVSTSPSGDYPAAKLTTATGYGCSGGGGGAEVYGIAYGYTGAATLSGAITLGSDVTITSYAATTTLSGALSGAFALNTLPGYAGKLIVAGSSNTTTTPNGTYAPAIFKKTLSDSVPANGVTILAANEITINGVRGAVTVDRGGVLKGTGTVGDVSLTVGSRIAPGNSPGCLSTGNLSFDSSSFYDAELGGTTACSGYDQLKVTGIVTLAGATLNTTLYNGFKPAKGNVFTIIDNDAADAVSGTFASLPEGATFTVSGYVFKVSYVGGTGNDVTLTVQSVPATPDTGFSLIKANPLASLAATTVLSAGILVIARRTRKLSSGR